MSDEFDDLDLVGEPADDELEELEEEETEDGDDENY